MREKGTKTRYPGVYRINKQTYRVTAKYKEPKTGQDKWMQRLLNGVSAQQAAAERDRLIAEKVNSAVSENPALETVGDFAKSWLASKAMRIEVATAERYAYALRHAMEHLGDAYVHHLRPRDLQQWLDAETRAGYKAETVRAWYSVVRTMLRDAVAALDLPRDPTLRVQFPTQQEEDEPNAFTEGDLVAFLKAMREHFPQHYALVATLAFTGLRFCHVSPLQWDDVDLKEGTLTIRRKQVKGLVGPVSRKKRAPKVYPLLPELVSVLQWQQSQCSMVGPECWVFPSRTGGLRKAPSTLQKAWSKCLTLTGIDKWVTPHGLRRTFNDLLRWGGVDSVVAKSLTGHVTERMREHYSTVRTGEQRAAVALATRKVLQKVEPLYDDDRVGPEVGPAVRLRVSRSRPEVGPAGFEPRSRPESRPESPETRDASFG